MKAKDHGWSTGQIKLFARRFAKSKNVEAWWTFVPEVRAALLTHFVMQIALSVDNEDSSIGRTTALDVNKLREDVEAALRLYHRIYVDPIDATEAS